MFEFSKSMNPAAGTLSKTGVGAFEDPVEATNSKTSALMILPPGPLPVISETFLP